MNAPRRSEPQAAARPCPVGAKWDPARLPPAPRIGPAGALLAGIRLVLLALLLVGGLGVLLLLRLPEMALFAPHRPLTSRLTQAVCRLSLRLFRLRLRIHGIPMAHEGALVANHCSWLDIFVLNAGDRITFISKAEVASWPLAGQLARATGTLFIRRNRAEALAQKKEIERRIANGARLLFFPEGTSTDCLRVLPFKSSLYAAFLESADAADPWIQPVAVIYAPPAGCPPCHYGWWGEMALFPHLLKVLSTWRPGAVELHFLAPLRVRDHESRKALALASERAIRDCHDSVLRRRWPELEAMLGPKRR